MGEATISSKALEDAMLKALPTLFPHLLETDQNARVEFYTKFQRQTSDHDRDFIKKYDEDLNTTLIFAGLFSAVASAFIISVETSLQPDYTQLSYTVLTIIANISLGHTPAGGSAAFPQFTGPAPAIVHVQAILYSSLAASLLAALMAMLGKQWLNNYSQEELRGSIIDRGRDRQRKINGMVTWRFDLVMECLPLMLQAALLLLGCALSKYLFTLNNVVAGVVVGFTSFGLLFYLLIISAATLSYNCPFQTPFFLVILSMIRFDDEHRKYLRRFRNGFRRTFFRKRRQPRPRSGIPRTLRGFNPSDGEEIGGHLELAMANPLGQQPPLFDEKTDWRGFVLDSNCIAWMFETSTDPDIILAIMKFVPEVVWHDGIRATPVEILYRNVLECFTQSTGEPVVIPRLRNKAYLSAKALLHLVIQRKCIGDGSDDAVFDSISRRHSPIGSHRYAGDSDLESTLSIVDQIFGDSKTIHLHVPSFTTTHHAWMGHILLYRAWDFIRRGDPLPADTREFVLRSLRLDPLPPAPIVTDCVFIVGLLLGINLHVNDLLVKDKGNNLDYQINRIYEKLVETLGNPGTSSAGEIDCALKAMRLIAPLSNSNIASKFYHLFRIVIRAPISTTYSPEKKWQAARLTIYGAYKWDQYLPPVGDPQDILTFLNHHFKLATGRGENQDEPIQYALRALAYDRDLDTIEAPDTTDPSFVRGICYAFQDARPFQLRKAAVFFLALIGDKWFNVPDPIMDPDQMRSLCEGWASSAKIIYTEHALDVKIPIIKVLLGMINSQHWRPFIVPETWNYLGQWLTSVPDCQPLERCLANPNLIDAISEADNSNARYIWLGLLWMKYEELTPEIREQLKEATKEADRSGRSGLDGYLEAVESQLERAERALMSYDVSPAHTSATALRGKIECLRQASYALLALKRG